MTTGSSSRSLNRDRPVVLVAIDQSDQADEAFHWYLDNVHKHGSDLLLLHVAEPPYVSTQLMYMTAEMYSNLLLQEKEKAKELEERFAHMMRERHVGGRIKAVFHPRPGEALIETAKEEKVELIVMGTRGLGTVRRTILGSVSDFVLHHAHCPICIFRSETSLHGSSSRLHSSSVSSQGRGHTGSQSRVHSGSESRVDTGSHGRVSAGSQSRVHSGSESRVDTGSHGRVSTGSQSREDTGSQGRGDTGSQSRLDTGSQGHADQ